MAKVERARLLAPFAGLEAGQEVVLKTLDPSASSELKDALIQEGRLGLELRHAALVRTLSVLPDFEGAPAIVFEWIPGESLAELIARGRIPEPLVRRIGVDVGNALAALHAAGWTHNDVKPENLRLDCSGAARLLDLGLATRWENPDITHTPGSLTWMAPERRAGQKPTPAADVYALGLVLFQSATGVLPSLPVPRPSSLAPRLSPFFDELVAGPLARRPNLRPSAAELAERCEAGEGSPWWRAHQAEERGPGTVTGRTEDWPIFGREKELAVLDRLAQAAFAPQATARPGALLLRGHEGIGKWELVSEFAARARRRTPPPLFLAIRANRMREARPLGTLLELLRSWLGLSQDRAPRADHIESLARLLPPKGAETLASVLDPAEGTFVPGSVSMALVDWLAALSEESPLCLFLDELQEAGPDTRRVALQLADVARDPKCRMMLVLGERDDLLTPPDKGLEKRAGEFMRLGPISEQALASFVRTRFRTDAPLLRLTRVLMRHSRGNPGLLSELMHTIESSGAARPTKAGKLQLFVQPEHLPLPVSLHASIKARFEGLDRPSRTLLARLAVLGGRLTPEVLQRAFPSLREVDLTSRLAELARLGWLVSYGDHFRFARPAQSEVIRASLDAKTLERLHLEAAEGLAPRPGERASVTTGIRRAWHLREAHRPRALVEAVRPVIRSLVARGQPQRIATLADWGLEALTELDRRPEGLDAGDQDLLLNLLELAADAAGRLGKRERERELLDRLADLDTDPERDPTRTARIYLLHGKYARATAAFGLARGLLKNALEFARKAGRGHLEAEALVQLARVQAEIGDLDHARELSAAALELFGDDVPGRAATLIAQAQIEILSARPDLALTFIDEALALGRRDQGRGATGLPVALKAEAHLARARIWRDLGRPARALGSAEKALELAAHAQERVLEVEASARLGGLLVVTGREDLAEAQLRDALLISEEIEDRRGACLARLWLGTLLAERKEGMGAEELALSSEEAGRIGLFRTQAMALAIDARVHLVRARKEFEKRGKPNAASKLALSAAEDLSLRAKALLERHGAEQRDHIVIHGTRAMLLFQTERQEEAKQSVRELRRAMRRANQKISDTMLRHLHRGATTRLLQSVLSPEGPVFPRG